MSIVCKIVYRYYGSSAEKWVDVDRYGYIDMLCDFYNTVLGHVEEGKNVSFLIKCILPGGVEEMEIEGDKDICPMFKKHECACAEKISLIAYHLIVADDKTEVYTINGYPPSLISRDSTNTNSSAGDPHNIIGTLESVVENPTMVTRPAKKCVRRGGSNSGRASATRNSGGLGTTDEIDGNGRERSDRGTRIGIRGTGRGDGRGDGSGDGRGDVQVYSKSVVRIGEGSSILKSSGIGCGPAQLISRSGVNDKGKGKNNNAATSSAFISSAGQVRVESNSSASPVDAEDSFVDGLPVREEDSDNECNNTGSGSDSDDEEWKANTDEEGDDDGIESEELDEINVSDTVDEMSDYNENDIDKLYGNEFSVGGDNMVRLEKGMVFGSVKVFREAIRDFSVQEQFETCKVKNEKNRVTLKCKGEGCTWRIHASPVDDKGTYMIKTYSQMHTCEKVTRNSSANSTWIAKKLSAHLAADPEMKRDSMVEALKSMRYTVDPSPMQLYRARQRAKDEVEGCHAKSYAQLPIYGQMILETNPGSLFILKYYDRPNMDLNPVFMRVFVCFEACRRGFLRGCRPFVGLDGCHLKGIYKGVFLAATSMDGNNGLFPVAFAVVEAESKDSWLWFLELLYTSLQMDSNDFPLTFMSDKQKGLAEAIAAVFPDANHRYCCRHLYNNFKTKHGGVVLRTYFWAAAKAPNEFIFNKAMDALKTISQDAYNWLQRIPTSMWARHSFDHRAKSDHITNNMSESFNQWISSLRNKPILMLIDQLRLRIMSRIQKRFEKGVSYKGKVTPMVKKKLELIEQDSRYCGVTYAGGDEYEVRDGFTRFVVNLRNWSCGCNVWEMSGVPCKHAAAAIRDKRARFEDFCSSFYSIEMYVQAHEGMIHPVPGLETLNAPTEGDVVQPPPFTRLPGRPHINKRRREPGEGPPKLFRRRAATVRCDICKQNGHNRRTCQRAPIAGKGKSTNQRNDRKRKSGCSSTSTTNMVTRSHNSGTATTTGSRNVRSKATVSGTLGHGS